MMITWPNKSKCVVALSFDVDGVSSAMNQNPETARLPSFMSMREYGPSVATPRILDMLDEYGIKASFFIPGFVAETHETLVKNIHERGHEIGHHGYLHEPPSTLTKSEEGKVLDKGSTILQRIIGVKPVGYRSPSWELSQYSLDLLIEREFLYDSSLMGHDVPYLTSGIGHILTPNHRLPDSQTIVEIPIHWELDDAPYFNYAPALGMRNVAASPEHVFQIWSSAFEGAYHYGGCFPLTMHPHTIGRPGRIRMLRRLIEYIMEFEGVEFMKMCDVGTLAKNSR